MISHGNELSVFIFWHKSPDLISHEFEKQTKIQTCFSDSNNILCNDCDKFKCKSSFSGHIPLCQ